MIEADAVVVRNLVGEYNGCMLGLLSGGSTPVLARARDVLHVWIGWRILEYSGSDRGGSYETGNGSDQLENTVFYSYIWDSERGCRRAPDKRLLIIRFSANVRDMVSNGLIQLFIYHHNLVLFLATHFAIDLLSLRSLGRIYTPRNAFSSKCVPGVCQVRSISIAIQDYTEVDHGVIYTNQCHPT